MLDVAALIVVGALLWDSLGVAHAILAGEDVSDAKFALLQRRGMEMALISAGVLVACAIMFCLWTYRVAKNAVAMGGRLSITPGWAVGYYFIPIVSLVDAVPGDGAGVGRERSGSASEPYQPRSHALLLGWWLSWLVSSGVDCWSSLPGTSRPRRRPGPTRLARGFVGLVVEGAAVAWPSPWSGS